MNKKASTQKMLKIILLIIFCLLIIFIASLNSIMNIFFPSFGKFYSNEKMSSIIDAMSNEINTTREKLSSSSFFNTAQNSVYSFDINVDQHFAYENNFPYYKDLNISLYNYANNETLQNKIKVSKDDVPITSIYSLITSSEAYLYWPDVYDGYFYNSESEIEEENNNYDEENYETIESSSYSSSASNPSLLYYLIQYSELNPEEFVNLSSKIFKDTINNLPNECYLSSFGPFNLSNLTISATDAELGQALSDALSNHMSDPEFIQLINNAFNGVDFNLFLSSLKEITNTNNLYTIEIHSSLLGNITSVSISTLIDSSFKSLQIDIGSNKILITMKNNDDMTEDNLNYTQKELDIRYSKSKEDTYNGYLTYTEGTASALISFNNLKITEGFINGEIELAIDTERSAIINMDETTQSVQLKIKDGNKDVFNLSVSAEPWDNNIITNTEITTLSKNKISDINDYIDSCFSSNNIEIIYSSLEIDNLIDWIDTTFYSD